MRLMMNCFVHSYGFAITLFVLFASSTDGFAASLPIANPGFEALSGPPNTTVFGPTGQLVIGDFVDATTTYGLAGGIVSNNSVPGWTVSGEAGTQADGSNFPGGLPDGGQNTAYINNGVISQVLSATIVPGDYTLHVDVGNRFFPNHLSNYQVELLAGSTLLAEDNNTLNPAAGTFATSTLTYTATAADPNLGQHLKIVLMSGPGTQQANFDSVTLTGPVPEPSTIVLMCFAGIGLAESLRRRLKN